jgi:hypothetical protein
MAGFVIGIINKYSKHLVSNFRYSLRIRITGVLGKTGGGAWNDEKEVLFSINKVH